MGLIKRCRKWTNSINGFVWGFGCGMFYKFYKICDARTGNNRAVAPILEVCSTASTVTRTNQIKHGGSDG